MPWCMQCIHLKPDNSSKTTLSRVKSLLVLLLSLLMLTWNSSEFVDLLKVQKLKFIMQVKTLSHACLWDANAWKIAARRWDWWNMEGMQTFVVWRTFERPTETGTIRHLGIFNHSFVVVFGKEEPHRFCFLGIRLVHGLLQYNTITTLWLDGNCFR